MTVGEYYTIINIIPDDYETQLDYEIDLISVVLKKDRIWFDGLSIVEQFNALKEVQSITIDNLITPEFIEIEDIKFYPIEFNDMSIGDWIGMDHFLKDINGNLLELMTILWRRKEQEDILAKVNWIDFNLKNKKYFYNVDWNIINHLTQFNKFKSYIEETYSMVFKKYDNGDDIMEKENLTFKDKIEIKEQIEKEKAALHWIWEDILMIFANDDYTKMSQATELPLIFCLNMLNRKLDKTANAPKH